MNPARSLGPAIATGIWTGQWIYWLGPFTGAAVASQVYNLLRAGAAHDSHVKL